MVPKKSRPVLEPRLPIKLDSASNLWGTNAIWYGSPQDPIEAFRAFQISPELQDKFGYPALTPEIKRKIFGQNAARIYRVSPQEEQGAQRFDAVAKARLEYRNEPSPSHLTYGPRSPQELTRLLASEQAH